MKRYYIHALAALSLTTSLYAEAYIGSIWATGADYCPYYTMPARGQLLDINGYPALFALIGTNYGGDGKTTFALPNLNGRTPVGLTNGIPSSSVVVLGTKRGQVSVPLTGANLPPHTHAAAFTPSGTSTPVAVNVAVSSSIGSANQPSSGVSTLSGSTPNQAGAKMWAQAPLAGSITVAGVSVSNGAGAAKVTLNPAGGSTSILTVPPVLGMTYCITVDGIFPPRAN